MGLLPNWDAFVHLRPAATVDAEGNVFNGVTEIGAGVGVYGSGSARDLEMAAQRKQAVDGFLSTEYNALQVGDAVDLRGQRWTVVTTKNLRIHNRIGLRLTNGFAGNP